MKKVGRNGTGKQKHSFQGRICFERNKFEKPVKVVMLKKSILRVNQTGNNVSDIVFKDSGWMKSAGKCKRWPMTEQLQFKQDKKPAKQSEKEQCVNCIVRRVFQESYMVNGVQSTRKDKYLSFIHLTTPI